MFLSSPLQERRGRPVLEKHAPKTAEEIEKLSENILTNPVTEDDVKNNEYWDKVVRYESGVRCQVLTRWSGTSGLWPTSPWAPRYGRPRTSIS